MILIILPEAKSFELLLFCAQCMTSFSHMRVSFSCQNRVNESCDLIEVSRESVISEINYLFS